MYFARLGNAVVSSRSAITRPFFYILNSNSNTDSKLVAPHNVGRFEPCLRLIFFCVILIKSLKEIILKMGSFLVLYQHRF